MTLENLWTNMIVITPLLVLTGGACLLLLVDLFIPEGRTAIKRIGDFIRGELARRIGGLKGVKEIRGKGLMIGVELEYPCGELVQQALESGLLINVTMDNVIRLLPPLVFRQEEAGLLLETLVPLITRFLDRQSVQPAAAQTA